MVSNYRFSQIIISLPEDGDVVALDILVGYADPGLLKQLLLVLVHLGRGGSDVEQDDLGIAIHEPATAMDLLKFRP